MRWVLDCPACSSRLQVHNEEKQLTTAAWSNHLSRFDEWQHLLYIAFYGGKTPVSDPWKKIQFLLHLTESIQVTIFPSKIISSDKSYSSDMQLRHAYIKCYHNEKKNPEIDSKSFLVYNLIPKEKKKKFHTLVRAMKDSEATAVNMIVGTNMISAISIL